MSSAINSTDAISMKNYLIDSLSQLSTITPTLGRKFIDGHHADNHFNYLKNGLSINCHLLTHKKVNAEGEVKIIGYEVILVNHCFENNKPVETPEGKRNRQIREAESNQFNLIMITFDDVRKLIAKDETRTLELKKTTGELYKGMETACAFLNSDAVMGFCLKHLNLAGRMDSKYRKDTLTVPYEAIKEATINMLCHRSWNAENTTPSLAIYDDRIVFQNPGAFPLGMTWLDFVNDQIGSLPANPTIANVFYRRGTMEAFIDWWCKNIRTPSGEDFTSNHNKIHNPSNIVTPQEKVFDFCKSPKSVVEIANMLGVNDRRWVRKKYVAPFIGTKLLCLTFGLTRHRE